MHLVVLVWHRVFVEAGPSLLFMCILLERWLDRYILEAPGEHLSLLYMITTSLCVALAGSSYVGLRKGRHPQRHHCRHAFGGSQGTHFTVIPQLPNDLFDESPFGQPRTASIPLWPRFANDMVSSSCSHVGEPRVGSNLGLRALFGTSFYQLLDAGRQKAKVTSQAQSYVLLARTDPPVRLGGWDADPQLLARLSSYCCTSCMLLQAQG